MRLFGKKKSSPTRREIAAERRAISEGVDGTFQRSRNITARQPLPDEPTERQASWNLKRRRQRLMRRLLMVVAFMAVVFVLLTQLTASIIVEAAGTKSDTDRDVYATTLNDYYKSRPVERLRFMINPSDLHDFFIEKAPEVQSIKLSGAGIGKTRMQLSFRRPTAQWSSGGKVYFVDDQGVTFEKNYFDTPSIVVKDESGVPASAGQEVINRRFLSFLGQSVAYFRKVGLTVDQVILPSDTVRQVEFRIEGKPYAVKMTVDRAAEAQVDEAVNAMSFLDARGQTPGYIDVRVDQRVFYK